jgi:hypothetical protein
MKIVESFSSDGDGDGDGDGADGTKPSFVFDDGRAQSADLFNWIVARVQYLTGLKVAFEQTFEDSSDASCVFLTEENLAKYNELNDKLASEEDEEEADKLMDQMDELTVAGIGIDWKGRFNGESFDKNMKAMGLKSNFAAAWKQYSGGRAATITISK